jgi:hypothetical protein
VARYSPCFSITKILRNLEQTCREGGGELCVGMEAKLLIDGLPASFDDEDLCALLRPYGTVLSAHIFTPATAALRRGGAVRMATIEEATRAIQTLDGVTLGDAVLHVLLVIRDHQPINGPKEGRRTSFSGASGTTSQNLPSCLTG